MESKEIKNGISLIMLVITIIVIIVISTAVILTLTKNNPIDSAKEASFKADVKTISEQLNVYISKQTTDTLGKFKVRDLELNETTTPNINEILTSIKGSNVEGKVEVKEGKLIYIGTNEEEKSWFDEVIGEAQSKIEEAKPGEFVSNDTPYTSENSNGEKNVAIIPKGFKVSEEKNEQTIETGLVVIAPDESEFVWIPVPENELNLFSEEGGTTDEHGEPNMRGRLWKFSKDGTTTGNSISYSSSNSREPDIVVDYDNEESNLNIINEILGTNMLQGSDLKSLIQREYNDIYESIKKYHGFYIGRYETGNLSQDRVVSKRGNEDIGNQNWYTMYAKQKNYANQLEKVKINSNMIYGSQWDAIMRWFAKSSNEEVESYPINAKNDVNANFSGSKKLTGALNAVNNIYDMAGNVEEWTVESYSTNSRSLRGYLCNTGTSGWYSGNRRYASPIKPNSYYGSRLSLYL